MRVAQFVHEPLAALYGFIRGASDPEEMARRLARRNVLVVDWGGGTLDLTLCRVDDVADSTTAQRWIGTGRRRRVRQGDSRRGRQAIPGSWRTSTDDDLAIPEAELRLLQDAERNKIELSADRVRRDVLPPELLPVRCHAAVPADPTGTGGDHPAARHGGHRRDRVAPRQPVDGAWPGLAWSWSSGAWLRCPRFAVACTSCSDPTELRCRRTARH